MEAKDRLKSAREELGISRELFGAPMGLSGANIRDLESGKVKLSRIHALAFESIYHISSVWLSDGVGEKEIRFPEGWMKEISSKVCEPDDGYIKELPEVNKRILQLPDMLDLDDEAFCKRLDSDTSILAHVKAGRPVSGLLIRAVAYEFGVRMRWLKMGETPFRNISGPPDHFAQEMWGLIQQAALKP